MRHPVAPEQPEVGMAVRLFCSCTSRARYSAVLTKAVCVAPFHQGWGIEGLPALGSAQAYSVYIHCCSAYATASGYARVQLLLLWLIIDLLPCALLSSCVLLA